jgi:hypothetical protein
MPELAENRPPQLARLRGSNGATSPSSTEARGRFRAALAVAHEADAQQARVLACSVAAHEKHRTSHPN